MVIGNDEVCTFCLERFYICIYLCLSRAVYHGFTLAFRDELFLFVEVCRIGKYSDLYAVLLEDKITLFCTVPEKTGVGDFSLIQSIESLGYAQFTAVTAVIVGHNEGIEASILECIQVSLRSVEEWFALQTLHVL